jgi:hypothetical protein
MRTFTPIVLHYKILEMCVDSAWSGYFVATNRPFIRLRAGNGSGGGGCQFEGDQVP